MFCRKCGKQIADDSAFCPECGANLAVSTENAVTQETELMAGTAVANMKENVTTTKSRKKLAAIIVAVVVIAVAVLVLLSGGDKGTFEGYSWEMSKTDVEKKVERTTDWVVNTDSETDEDELSYKGTYEGYASLILFKFDSNSALESVNVYPIITTEDGAAAAFESYKSKLQGEYGEPETLPNVTGYAKWKTETSEITAMVIIDTIVAVTYKKAEPTE